MKTLRDESEHLNEVEDRTIFQAILIWVWAITTTAFSFYVQYFHR